MKGDNRMEYQRKCLYCGKVFVAHSKKRVYCSILCKDTAFRLRKGIRCNPSVEAEKKICVVCGKEFETRRKEQTTCSHECSVVKMRKRKTDSNKLTKVCVVCGESFETFQDRQKTCGREECKTTYRKAAHNAREVARYEKYRLEREKQNESRKVERECVICGSLFSCLDTSKRKTCSGECSALLAVQRNRLKNKYKDKRIPTDQIIDTDITNIRLFKRDRGRCWICGGLCDWNDRKLSKRGNETFGDTYPSIDHVIPVSMGGMHSWDNVRLAHLKCNEDKSDTLIAFDPMPMKIAYKEKRFGNPGKKTAQISLTGEVVKIWESTAQIQREIGLNAGRIQDVCRGEGKTAFGFVWKYV